MLFLQNYENVKKWIKDDIFSKEFLLFPLNPKEHWSLAIVYNPKGLVTNNKGSMLYLDSYGTIDDRIMYTLSLFI